MGAAMIDVVIPMFMAGVATCVSVQTIWSMLHKKKPEPVILPPRQTGDLLLHKVSGLPVLLLGQISHDKFNACYITPNCHQLNATVGPGDVHKKALEQWFALHTNNRNVWPDYTHPLSDEEHRNYAKAMLEVEEK